MNLRNSVCSTFVLDQNDWNTRFICAVEHENSKANPFSILSKIKSRTQKLHRPFQIRNFDSFSVSVLLLTSRVYIKKIEKNDLRPLTDDSTACVRVSVSFTTLFLSIHIEERVQCVQRYCYQNNDRGVVNGIVNVTLYFSRPISLFLHNKGRRVNTPVEKK